MVCRQTEPTSDVEEWLHPRPPAPTPPLASPPRVVLSMAYPIGYCLVGSSCSHDPDWWIQGRNGCLLVVSVTHTTPPCGRLCLVVMIHHSCLSGTLLSEDDDIIPISSWEEDGKKGAHPNKPWDLGVLMGVTEVWERGWHGCGWS